MTSVIDELTRFAFYINDKMRDELLKERKELGDDEFAFERCVVAYFYPTGTPKEAIEEFLKVVSLGRLLELIEKGKSVADVKTIVTNVAKAIPGVRPGPKGWSLFEEFIGNIIEIAKKKDGKLASAFTDVARRAGRSRGAEELQKALLEGELKMAGIAEETVPCLIRDLALSGLIDVDLSPLDIALVEPVRQVLERTGLIGKSSTRGDAKTVVRRHFRIPPMTLDYGIWYIGANYCIKDKCDICPITHVCPKK